MTAEAPGSAGDRRDDERGAVPQDEGAVPSSVGLLRGHALAVGHVRPVGREQTRLPLEAWSAWILERSGDTPSAPANLGSDRHPALEPAPGSYVLDRVPAAGRASSGQPVAAASGRR